LLLVLIDALEDAIHLLLEEQLELLDHELVDWAPFHKVGNQTLHCVALVHDDPLDAKIGNIDIDVEFGFTVINRSTSRLLLQRLFRHGLRPAAHRLDSVLLAAQVLDRRGHSVVIFVAGGRCHLILALLSHGKGGLRLVLRLMLLVLLHLALGLLEWVAHRVLLLLDVWMLDHMGLGLLIELIFLRGSLVGIAILSAVVLHKPCFVLVDINHLLLAALSID